MGMVYQWKPGSVLALPAQLAGQELERIRVHHNGRLTQEDIVEEARPEEAPLHPAFEWDDSVAAKQWRLEQAGYLIRSITVTVEGEDARPPIRAFVNVERDTDRSYTSIGHAMSDAELRAQVLSRALKELESWRVKYQELTELASLFTAITKTTKRLVA